MRVRVRVRVRIRVRVRVRVKARVRVRVGDSCLCEHHRLGLGWVVSPQVAAAPTRRAATGLAAVG